MSRAIFQGRVGIEHRPVSIKTRRHFGHWESDTLEGGKGKGGLATHVERKSRYLVTVLLPDQRARTYADRTMDAFKTVPPSTLKTLTADNGKEFAECKRLENTLGTNVYFAHPYSAWERGTNENTNGLLRRYFPKGFDFNSITRKDVARVMKKLNNRPRKCLNYRTPHEVFFNQPGVALIT